jgi:mercuric reductase
MIELQVEGMTCGSCTERVKQALEQVAGVRAASVFYPQGLAAVATDGHVSLEPLVAAVTAEAR